MGKRVLLVGESWVSEATHYKGFDSFTSVTFHSGADWYNNPQTQIKWGASSIDGRYGNPCGALGHSNSTGWY